MATQVEADYFVTCEAPLRALQQTISLHGIVSDVILGVSRRVVQPVTPGTGAWCAGSCTQKSDKPLVVEGER